MIHSNLNNTPPPPKAGRGEIGAGLQSKPADTPTGFARLSVYCALELNSRLEMIRQRVFGDEIGPRNEGGSEPKAPSDPPLQNSLDRIHWELTRALEQAEAILNRL